MKYQISHHEVMTTQALRACQVAAAALYLVRRIKAKTDRRLKQIACLAALCVVAAMAASELIARGVIHV